jgi:hypothetical protein
MKLIVVFRYVIRRNFSLSLTEMNSKFLMCSRTLSRNLQRLFCNSHHLGTSKALYETLMCLNRLYILLSSPELSVPGPSSDEPKVSVLNYCALLVTGCIDERRNGESRGSNSSGSISVYTLSCVLVFGSFDFHA